MSCEMRNKIMMLAALLAAGSMLGGCHSDRYQKVETRAVAEQTETEKVEISSEEKPLMTAALTVGGNELRKEEVGPGVESTQEIKQESPSAVTESEKIEKNSAAESIHAADHQTETGQSKEISEVPASNVTVSMNSSWKYADHSRINSGTATLFRSQAAQRKNKTVCVNAGHGTAGGGSVKTLCHPDGSAKVTGGTTSAGAKEAVAVSGGMTFLDGTPEAKVTLAMAKELKQVLLDRGYDVLMIRDGDDVQLDNVARTVMANHLADCHLALHWDSTEKDKGAFYMSVPDNASYRKMEPVASHWQQHHALGDALIAGLKNAGVKIFSNGTMAMDLTQTSYSTIPSVDIELGDKKSDHSEQNLKKLAAAVADGVDRFFQN